MLLSSISKQVRKLAYHEIKGTARAIYIAIRQVSNKSGRSAARTSWLMKRGRLIIAAKSN